MRRMAWALTLSLMPGALAGQQVRTAVLPHDITVGDVFQVVVQVAPVTNGSIAFPDSLTLPADLESAGRRVVRVDTVEAGVRWTAAFPVTGWRPGRHALSPLPVGLSAGGGSLTAQAVFPDVVIRSVLPADTAGVQPQPPHDVMGASRVWWPWLLLGLLLALAAGLAFYWYRRRRRLAPARPAPAVSPQAAALRALAAARASGALEAGDFRRFYSDISAALRAYQADVEPQLGTDLTTSELARALRATGQDAAASGLLAVLHAADLVKFARHRPTSDDALSDWERAHSWLASQEDASGLARAA